jgi:hypothetical protein
MNKKGQIAQVLVFVVLFIIGLFTLAMFEKESGFISETIGSWIEVSDSPVSNILIRLIVPAFIFFSILSVFLVIRGSLF